MSEIFVCPFFVYLNLIILFFYNVSRDFVIHEAPKLGPNPPTVL